MGLASSEGLILGDTIAAIATAVGGAVGIVRISGPAAQVVASKVVSPWPEAAGAGPTSHKLWRACAADDEILCVVMVGPRSYTGEDVVELHGHGGPASLTALLEAVLAAGARLAEPGEFTRRAFMNGRLDLAQAEAVSQLIAAQSGQAARLAQANLRGALSQSVTQLRGRLVDVLAELEAELDFPDEQLELDGRLAAGHAISKQVADTTALASTWRAGRVIADGLTIALVGAPNVGKSSLLNALAGEERAVVTDRPGTTRDFIEVTTTWQGISVKLIDTAGERGAAEGVDPAEQRAIELGRARAAHADLVVRVYEATSASCREAKEAVPRGRSDLVVWSKVDLVASQDGFSPGFAEHQVSTSVVTGQGLDLLKATCLTLASAQALDPDAGLVSSERQHQALMAAAERLTEAGRVLSKGLPIELACAELHRGLSALGSVLGEEVGEAVLDALFARFCIGK